MILDVGMPNMGGLEVLRRVKETHPDVDVIMMTGMSQVETVVQARKYPQPPHPSTKNSNTPASEIA
jgi:DNA-binding NtrC family response regulator